MVAANSADKVALVAADGAIPKCRITEKAGQAADSTAETAPVRDNAAAGERGTAGMAVYARPVEGYVLLDDAVREDRATSTQAGQSAATVTSR